MLLFLLRYFSRTLIFRSYEIEYIGRYFHLDNWLWSLYIIFILPTQEGSHNKVYREFHPVMTSSAGGAKGCLDHRLREPPVYPVQLLTLHQHRANNQYRTANQI